MPIVFDEVIADIAPPPAPEPADGSAGTAPADRGEVEVRLQLRQTLALLREREARLFTD